MPGAPGAQLVSVIIITSKRFLPPDQRLVRLVSAGQRWPALIR